jgi:hypothetical protein
VNITGTKKVSVTKYTALKRKEGDIAPYLKKFSIYIC